MSRELASVREQRHRENSRQRKERLGESRSLNPFRFSADPHFIGSNLAKLKRFPFQAARG